MEKTIKPSEYVALYRQIEKEFKTVDIPTREYVYMGQKTLIQILPYISDNDNPIVRYRVIYPQGYTSEPTDYKGIVDLPFWMHVKNEIVNTINNHYLM